MIEAIHAGLECGFWDGKMENVDIISMGPDMMDVHTGKRACVQAVNRQCMEIIKRDCKRHIKNNHLEKIIGIFLKTDDFFLLSGRLMMFHTKIIRNDSNEFGICRLSGSRIDTVTK